MPSARLIVNPTSGGGRGATLARQASLELQRRGCQHEVLYSSAPTDPGVFAAQAVRDGCTLVVGVGGDGLVPCGRQQSGRDAGDAGHYSGRTRKRYCARPGYPATPERGV